MQGVDDSSQKAEAEITTPGIIVATNAFGVPGATDHEYGMASFVYTAMDAANPDVVGESLLTVYFSLPTPQLVIQNALMSDGVYRISATEDVNITLTIQQDLGLFGSLIFRGLPDAAHTGITYSDSAGLSHTIALTQTLDASKGSGLWSTSDAGALRADTFHIDLPEHASGVFDFEIEGLAKYGSVRSNIVRKVVLDVAPIVSGLKATTSASVLAIEGGQEDTESVLDATKIRDYLSALKSTVVDGDGSEFAALDLVLPVDWTGRFSGGTGFVATKLVDSNGWRIAPTNPTELNLSASLEALQAGLGALRIQGPLNYSGEGEVLISAFTAEDTTPAAHSAAAEH